MIEINEQEIQAQDNRTECKWEQDEDGNWDTDCGNLHVLLDGGPKENRMLFCCYCGKPIVEPVEPEQPKVKRYEVKPRNGYLFVVSDGGQLIDTLISFLGREDCKGAIYEIAGEEITHSSPLLYVPDEGNGKGQSPRKDELFCNPIRPVAVEVEG